MNHVPVNTSVVSCVVITKSGDEGRILLLKRVKGGFWCHVAGKVKEEETASEAIRREIREELSIEAESLYSADFIEQFYDMENNCITFVTAFVAQVKPGTRIILNEEHTEYKWCSVEEAKALVSYPNQKGLYDYVWSNFLTSKPADLLKIS